MSIKVKRGLLIAAQWVLLVAGGVLIGLYIDNIILIFAAIIVWAGLILLVNEWLKKTKLAHLFPASGGDEPAKLSDEHSPLAMKGVWKYILLVMQLCGGALLGYGGISLVFTLLPGTDEGFAMYLGMVVGGVVVLAVATALQVSRSTKFKEDLMRTESDERTNACAHKAGYVAMWATLAALLIFGGAAAALPIEDVNTVITGILIVCALGFLVYPITYHTLMNQAEPKPANITLLSALFFVLSLIPTGLMAAQWIVNGLSQMGIAYFAALAVVSAVLLVEAILQRKIRKK